MIITDNCLNCRKFTDCDSPKKSGSYICKSWKAFSDRNTTITLDDFQLSGVSSREDHRDHVGFKAPDGEDDYKTKELNLKKMMDDVFNNHNPWSKDMKIDDSDMKEFPNIYEYFFDRDWGLVRGMKPFARQMWIGMVLFGDFCPKCSDPKFISDIENVPVKMKAYDFPEKVQFLNFGVCPKCKSRKSKMIKAGHMNYYRELDAVIGQRAGKSVSVAFFASYLLHKYLKMQRPAEVMTGLPNVVLAGTFTATDFKTANETLWQPFCNVINESPWFQQYHLMLDYYSAKYNTGKDTEHVYKYMESFLSYKHRKLFLSAAAPNVRNLRGRTRFISAIDELGWFDSSVEAKDRIRSSADGIYGALDRSLRTVRTASKLLMKQGYDNVSPAMSFNISSPSSQQDFIMTMVRKNQGSRIVLPIHLATWEYNPKEPKSGFTKEYNEDPVKAERDYGANPPMTDSPFLENEEAIRKCFTAKVNAADVEFLHKKKKDKNYLLKGARVTPKPQGDIYPSIIAIDAGYSNNSFAMLCLTKRNKDVTVEIALDVIPDKGKSVLHYPKIFDLSVTPIIQKMNVRFITADRWNSIFLLQKCEEDFSIKSEQYSCKYADFTLAKSFLEGGRIKFPRMEMTPQEIMQISMEKYPMCFEGKPLSHLYFQLMTVSDTGKTVTKGANRTDDLFRALVLGCHYLLDEEWCKENLKGKMRNQSMGIVALSSGGSSGVITTSGGRGIGAG